MDHKVIGDRNQYHAELDRFLDRVCTDLPRWDDGIVYELRFRGGIEIADDDYYLSMTATLKTMRSL